MIQEAVVFALKNPGVNVYVVMPNYRIAEFEWSDLTLRLAQAYCLVVGKKNRLTIELPNLSQIRFISAESTSSLYGHRVHGAVCHPRVPDVVRTIMRGQVIRYNGDGRFLDEK